MYEFALGKIFMKKYVANVGIMDDTKKNRE